MNPPPRTCNETTLLPLHLFAAVVQMTGADWMYVEERPTCFTQAGHAGPHHGLVVELEGETTGAVWALWDTAGSLHLQVLADCPAAGEEACAYYQDHEGAHSWDVHDPLHALARGQMARILTEHGITLPRQG